MKLKHVWWKGEWHSADSGTETRRICSENRGKSAVTLQDNPHVICDSQTHPKEQLSLFSELNQKVPGRATIPIMFEGSKIKLDVLKMNRLYKEVGRLNQRWKYTQDVTTWTTRGHKNQEEPNLWNEPNSGLNQEVHKPLRGQLLLLKWNKNHLEKKRKTKIRKPSTPHRAKTRNKNIEKQRNKPNLQVLVIK